ncbi:MAG: serine/threonine protein kinase, partial [Planctomycetes bacterium]|nr:serine/threonine protein kinase [Planctomycetota bacterium]
MRHVGPYEITRELGRGAHGVVYEARRGPDSPRVAVKVLLRSTSDREGRARFTREAQIAGKLRHPGIVPVIDFGLHDEHPYCVMEFCEGSSLARLLAAGPLPPADAVEIVAEVAAAMDYAHRTGVIHRDLKPGNIMIDPQGRARVTDFGLARDRNLRESLTRTGDVLGTPVTMAPEQVRGERGVDHRADVYALGATLYRCLTGRYPHQARGAVELMEQVCSRTPPAPGELDPRISPELSAVCMRALEKLPAERYPSCEAFAAALAAALTAAAPAPRRRRRALALGVAGLGLLLALPVGWALRARGRSAAFTTTLAELESLRPTAADARAARGLLERARGLARHTDEGDAVEAARRRLTQGLLARVRGSTTGWGERAELLELVPALDPEAAQTAHSESLVQALALAAELGARGDGVPQGPELLRRLARGDAELVAQAAAFEAALSWERQVLEA